MNIRSSLSLIGKVVRIGQPVKQATDEAESLNAVALEQAVVAHVRLVYLCSKMKSIAWTTHAVLERQRLSQSWRKR